MYHRILEAIDRVGAYENEDYKPERVSNFINDEVKKFIRGRLDPERNQENQGFEADLARLEDLDTLVNEYPVIFDSESTAPDEYKIVLPDGTELPKWQYFAAGTLTLKIGLKTKANVPVVLVKQNVANLLRLHPFARSHTNRVLATTRKGTFTFLTDKRYILIDGKLIYIQKPAEVFISLSDPSICVDCDLPEHVHHEIVALTAKSLLEATESQRYQTKKGETIQFE